MKNQKCDGKLQNHMIQIRDINRVPVKYLKEIEKKFSDLGYTHENKIFLNASYVYINENNHILGSAGPRTDSFKKCKQMSWDNTREDFIINS